MDKSMININNKLIRNIKNIFETNKYLSKLFDIIASSKLYRYLIFKKIKNYSQKIKKSRKYNIIIETTNLCNAHCIMCPHDNMKRNKKVMSNEIFEEIIHKIKKEKIEPVVFILNGFGEPLTDIKITERIKLIKTKFPNSIVKIYTNLGLANKKIIFDLVKSGLDEINISFNGYDKTSYEKTMKINYYTSLSNLNNLIQQRNKYNPNLKIRISMALVYHNDKTIKKFISKWKNKVDSVSVNKIHTYGGSVKDVSGRYKINFNKKPFPCKYLWNTIVFGVEGDMFLCCLDYEGKYNFGNIKKNNILDMFYSEKFENIRKMHLDGNLNKIKMCKYCYTPYKNGVEWLIDELY